MNFDKAIKFTLKWEGGETYDTGGHTKYGISKRGHPDVDIKNLTLAQAKAIYKKDYWDKLNLDEIRFGNAWAVVVFDTAVNLGVGRVSSWVKDETIETWQDLLLKRIEWYVGLAKRPLYAKYLRGWLNRVVALNHFVRDL
jgi:hypothetical protein